MLGSARKRHRKLVRLFATSQAKDGRGGVDGPQTGTPAPPRDEAAIRDDRKNGGVGL
jgi:hypothetical protein